MYRGDCTVGLLGGVGVLSAVKVFGIATLTCEWSCLIYQKENINATQPSKAHATRAAKTVLQEGPA